MQIKLVEDSSLTHRKRLLNAASSKPLLLFASQCQNFTPHGLVETLSLLTLHAIICTVFTPSFAPHAIIIFINYIVTQTLNYDPFLEHASSLGSKFVVLLIQALTTSIDRKWRKN